MSEEEKFRKALADYPDAELKVVAMTPELKEKLSRVCDEIWDELKKRTSGPFEGYMVLQFLVQTFEELYEIHAIRTVKKERGTADA